MSKEKIIATVEELKELESFAEELKAEIESLKDELKAELTEKGVEEMAAGQYIIRYANILSSRFDTKRFKTELGEDLYKKYTKEVASKRFTISA